LKYPRASGRIRQDRVDEHAITGFADVLGYDSFSIKPASLTVFCHKCDEMHFAANPLELIRIFGALYDPDVEDAADITLTAKGCIVIVEKG